MTEEKHMNPRRLNAVARSILLATLVVALFGAPAIWSQAQTKLSEEASSPQPGQKTFATPQQAAEALIHAAEQFDVPALNEMFGPDGKNLVTTADAVQDKNRVALFVAKAHAKTSVTTDPKSRSRAMLSVGDDDWPFPVPIVKKGGRWSFDSKAGRQEILARRIGANELDAIAICHGFVNAQEEYASAVHDDSGITQYAQRIISTPGKRDGLVWRNPDGSLGGPISEKIADAIEQGYTKRGEPYHGYYFKVLKGQGPAAPMGQLDFVIEGVMIGGFALVAAPAGYRVTGVKTFIVSHNGIVYQKDLGPDTLKAFEEMERYNPDKTWHRTDDEWPPEVAATGE